MVFFHSGGAKAFHVHHTFHDLGYLLHGHNYFSNENTFILSKCMPFVHKKRKMQQSIQFTTLIISFVFCARKDVLFLKCCGHNTNVFVFFSWTPGIMVFVIN